MKKRMFQMLAIVVPVIAGLGFVKFRQIQAAIAAGKSWAAPPVSVTSIVAKQEMWRGTLGAVGSIEPVQGVTLSADLAGVVDRIAFESGSRAVLRDRRDPRGQRRGVPQQRHPGGSAPVARSALGQLRRAAAAGR